MPTARRRRWTVAAIGTGAALGVTLVVWLGVINASPPVSWKDVGFTVDGDARVEVQFDVMRSDPLGPAQCRIQALKIYHAQVGVVTVDIPPGRLGAQRHSATVATSEEATTGLVESCWLVDQG